MRVYMATLTIGGKPRRKPRKPGPRKSVWGNPDRYPNDPRHIFRFVSNECDNNGGKLITLSTSKQRFVEFRDRQKEVTYFNIRMRGNFLTATKIQYIFNGKPSSYFIAGFIEGSKVEEVKVEEILRMPIRQWREFTKRFRELSPSLEWFD